jgi:hypothetical protein
MIPLFNIGIITLMNENKQLGLYWNYTLDTSKALNDAYTLVIEFWLVITSIFVVFATLLPKVDDERQIHYKNLNKYVFQPLSNLSIHRQSQEFPQFTSSITLPINRMYYQQALNHLKKDNPNFDIEKTISELNELIKKINENTDELQNEISKAIDGEFRKDKTVSSAGKYDIKETLVKRIILQCWEKYYKSIDYQSNKSIPTLKKYFPDCECFPNAGIVNFRHVKDGSYETILHNMELTPEIVLDKVDNIIRNTNAIKILNNLHILQNKLESSVNEIKQSVNEIPSLIDNKEYRTYAKCCPGMFTLVFNYLK